MNEHDSRDGSVASERVVVTAREELSLVPWRAPAPGPGMVRIRVDHSAVSFGDVMLRRHVFRDRPRVAVPGYEVVGTIDAIGPNVTDLRAGERGAAFVEYGGNARHAIVPATDVVALPGGVGTARAAAAVLNYPTAFGMIESAKLGAGDDFLVHGATGGVGSALLDVARSRELRAYGTTRRRLERDPYGARLFDARSPELVAEVKEASRGGVRAVFDPRAGRGLWRSRRMVRRGGSLVVFGLSAVANRGLGAAAGTVATLATLAAFRVLPGKRSSIFAIDKTFRRDPLRVRAWVARTLDMLATGEIDPIIGATLPLDRVREGQRLIETGEIVGKVVIDCR